MAAAALLVAAATTAMAMRLWQDEQRRLPTGPIHTLPEGREIIYGGGAPNGYGIGTRFADGLLGSVNLGTARTVTVIDIRPVGGGQALRFLGARVVPTPRGDFPYNGFDDYLGWPDPAPAEVKLLGRPMWAAMHHSEPAEDAVLPPAMVDGKLHNEPMILLGFEVVRDTYEIRKGVRIDYQVDGKDYSAFFALRFEYCPTYPVKGTDGHCTGVKRPATRQ